MTRQRKTDAPRAPESPGGWDVRSEELVAEAAVSGAETAAGSGAVSGTEAPAVSGAGAGSRPTRRGAGDPVKALMHRHRELCERAVDPLEIAAGLEAHGVTDRTAARFRHRDVFALAEEMYARVPRGEEERGASMAPPSRRSPDLPAGWALFALLPGVACGLTVVGLELGGGRARFAVGLGGLLAVSVALRVALRFGPLRSPHQAAPATRAWVCFLLAYALLGDELLRAAVAGGPDEPWAPSLTAALGLSLAVAPGVWCARLFAVAARKRLALSKGLTEFSASVRPLLLGVVALYLCALWALLLAAGAVQGEPAPAGAGALGALLLLSALLSSYGFTRAPLLTLGAAGAVEAGSVASVFAARLPGCDWIAVPVEEAVQAWGPGAVPVIACGAAAAALLLHAARVLSRASAHADETP
ncbi:hypothetical protein [Streptomyces sp. NPDC048436]|uniref:hypothetical protein n=1 Tax=Streptomyces sp. NPDC048436 TaxID=3365550 RepID=UPI0037198772